MDGPVIALLLVLLVVLGLGTYGVLYAQHVMRQRTPPDAYKQERVRHWVRTVARTWETTTLGGFAAEYRLRASVKWADGEKFEATLMLREGNEVNPLITFWSRFVQIRFFPWGKWFLRYGWTGNGAPSLQLFRFGEGASAGTEIFDANGSDLKQATNEEAHAVDNPCDQYGCKVELLLFDKLFDADMIEENYKMLSEQDRAQGAKFLEYQRFKEAAVIMALKLRLDLSEHTSDYHGDHVNIQVSVVDNRVGLSWELSEAARKDKDRLLGFRRAGSFETEDPITSETRPGELIVDTDRNGSCTDVPTAGQTLFYTFYLREKLPDGNYKRYSLVRFSVAIPSTSEIGQLKRLLEESRSAQSSLRGAQDRERERRSRIVDKVNLRVETREVFMELRKRKVAEVKADSTKTEAEKNELIDAIEAEISDASAALSMD